jgi:hypothetical protein
MHGFRTRGIGPAKRKPVRESRPPTSYLGSPMGSWGDNMVVTKRKRAKVGGKVARRRREATVIERGRPSEQVRGEMKAELERLCAQRDQYAAAKLADQARAIAHRIRELKLDLGAVEARTVEIAQSADGSVASAMGKAA